MNEIKIFVNKDLLKKIDQYAKDHYLTRSAAIRLILSETFPPDRLPSVRYGY